MEAHYFQNDCFMQPDQLLTEAGKLAGIPGIIVQGRYDLLCPPATSHALAAAWPEAEIRFVEGAGHSLYDPGVRDAVMKAIADLASKISQDQRGYRKMPLAGKGMLLTSMDIDAATRPNSTAGTTANISKSASRSTAFSKRGAMSRSKASRNISASIRPRPSRCSTARPIARALANPTDWSKTNMARFKNMIRAVARITISRGNGRGAALGIVRLRPTAGSEDALRATLTERLDPARLDGIISMHLIESDPALSRPIADNSVAPIPAPATGSC